MSGPFNPDALRPSMHPACLFRPCFLLCVLLVLLISPAVGPARGQHPEVLKWEVPAPAVGAQGEAGLGRSVAINGDFVIVGAPLVGSAGVAKVFDSSTGALLHVLANPRPGSGSFGSSVAASGRYAVVGAPGDDTGASDAGVAYVYDLTSPAPTVPMVVLENPTPWAGERFGESVAVDGTRVVVGTYFNRLDGRNEGNAYVYDLAGASPSTPTATLHRAGSTSGDSYGAPVAISGTLVVVGAPNASLNGNVSGRVNVYDLASATPMIPVAVIENPDASRTSFGNSVGLSGSRLVVGSPYADHSGTDTGAAYVFELTSVTPTSPVRVLTKPLAAPDDTFGYSVSVHGAKVVVGCHRDDTSVGDAGSAYVYDLEGVTPAEPVLVLNNPTPALGDTFGVSVSVNGTRLVVGAPSDDTRAMNAGAAYLYEISGTTPTVPAAVLDAPSPSRYDYFGHSVAISGSRFVVGAYLGSTGATNTGSAYVYDVGRGPLATPAVVLDNPTLGPDDRFGSSVAISGPWVVVGAPFEDTGATNAGSAYVYDVRRPDAAIPVAVLRNPTPQNEDRFGWSVAVEGTRVLVGAYRDATRGTQSGSVYVYDLGGATPAQPTMVLSDPASAIGSHFGRSVAISGTKAIIGASGDDTGATNAGAAYVYDFAGADAGTPIAVLNNPSPGSFDEFGYSVAISGDGAVVGAYSDDTGTADAGSAYVYNFRAAQPTQPVAVLNNPNANFPGFFGYSVAISKSTVVVGAYYDGTVGQYAGIAYVYDVARTSPTLPVATLSNGGIGWEFFGESVAVDGGVAIIGAPWSNITALEKGAAYLFGPADSTTESPVLTLPSAGQIASAPIPVSFTLPEAALGGSVQLAFDDGIAKYVLTLAASEEAIGQHAFALDPKVPANSPQVASGSAIPEGVYRVTLSYRDALGNGVTSASAENVRIDTTGPAFGDFTPEVMIVSQGSEAELPDYTTESGAADVSGVVSITQSPSAGTLVGEGSLEVTLRATDAAGNVTEKTFTAFVRVGGTAVLARRGDFVPNPDADPRIPAGAKWTNFGVPSIANFGQRAGWAATVTAGPGVSFRGIFYGPLGAPTMRLRTGDPVADANAMLVHGEKFASFREPVFAGDHFAVVATVRGIGVQQVSDSGLWFGDSNGLRQVAREWAIAPGTKDGARYGRFLSLVTTRGGTVFFTATLSGDPARGIGLWVWTPQNGARLALRPGEMIENGDLSKIGSFRALGLVPGSPGQGRYQDGEDAVWVLATTTIGKTLHVRVDALGNSIRRVPGPWYENGPAIARLGIPSPNEQGFCASAATLRTDPVHEVSMWNNRGIFADDFMARKGSTAPGAEPATFRTFDSPVAGRVGTTSVTAFEATLAGTSGRAASGIWHVTNNLRLVARQGLEPHGAMGTKWAAFQSLALQDARGPLFTARIVAGSKRVTARDNQGLWATQTDGSLRLLVRKGDVVDGKAIRGFTALSAVPGSPGQRRSWTVGDMSGRVIYRAIFEGGSSAIISTAVP